VPAWAPRLPAIGLALLALAWSTKILPVFWQSRGVEATADLILQGHRFATSELAAESAKADATGLSRSAVVRRSLAMIKLRLVEDALASGDRLSLDQRLAALKQSTVDLLAIDPSDSFFWLIYYWCDVTMEGFAPPQLKYLEASYDFGPDEGWIAIRRNRLALAVFSQLSPAMSERVMTEFTQMVSSGLIVDAAASLVGTADPLKSELLARLTAVPIAERQRFARYLQENGIDLVVPGVAVPEKHFY
jgi:hypothetical protein